MYYENLYYFCTAINKAREQQVKTKMNCLVF
ncbi:hypothetical protein HMPREF1077_01448 [Parabacteroides johnsonii CL02T12C29]|uniref:Uncharacterized protein n=1 Tax=Parabacteroides johnsonii CL02T12C29 TaxID=999419 RepID=K5ZIT8_9BACT|nr:hypothetical protein HMPREF1077_01448 [Parabacteroides johnsonii CL02T12C29]CCX78968.1 unknown [Parabacteroides johnsonii CAG:246]